MASKYLTCFPKPLLNDLVSGRWLPIVGAGFSLNAVIPSSKRMPLWSDLSKSLEAELTDYSPSGVIDAISAYEHEFGRSALIEKFSNLLLIGEARPGKAHRSFCRIPFDIVCTTNFDFLLEHQYDQIPRQYTPLIDEDQLSINSKESGVGLLKLHGDLHHPNRLIATENDYDRFLDKYPLLATFLASLLITRTAILVGYSLDDPDFRQIWQIIGERLGRSRRVAYVIQVGTTATEVARYLRRGVRVITLPGSPKHYSDILAEAFDELRQYWVANVIPASQVKEERPLQELSLPSDAPTKLCFFAMPLALQPFYRERIFPLVYDAGFVPVTADDIVSPGDTFLPKIDALIDRSFLFVVDAASQFTLMELGLALNKIPANRILAVVESATNLPIQLKNFRYLLRPDLTTAEPENFLAIFREWLRLVAQDLGSPAIPEPRRLLDAGEYRAALISAITLLETTLRQRFSESKFESKGTLRSILERAHQDNALPIDVKIVLEWLRLRNETVHGQKNVSKTAATKVVNGVFEIISALGPS